MNLSPKRLALYKDIGLLFLRHARPAIVEQTTFAEDMGGKEEASDDPEAFARALEKMGPTFVKLGQLLSTRGDLLPRRYLIALERLQDDVEPVPFPEIALVVEKGLDARLSKAFREFDETPLASASLGQVHRAVIHDGTEVVVKVQRPNIRSRIAADLNALAEIAEYADDHTELGRKYRFSGIIEQFRRSLSDELDYTLEVRNLKQMREALKDYDSIVVPRPFESYCSARVLTMEKINGVKITDVSGVTKTEIDGQALAEEIFKAYLQQVLSDGFYHADPHPGNLILTREHKLALIDLGMVGRVNERMRDELFNLLNAISENQSDRVGEVALRIAEYADPRINKRAFVGELADLIGAANGASIESLQFGSVVMEIMRISSEYGIKIPKEISLLGKTLLNLDRVGLALSPDFDPNESIRRNLTSLARKRTLQSLKTGSLMASALELKNLVAKSPQRINDILTNLAENKFRVDIDAIDEKSLVQGFQKVANRITMGAIIGSMIVGASLMMRIESSLTAFGYPLFPMALFIIAALCGFWMMISIVRHDE